MPTPREELRDRIDIIEEAYEFLLGYAAQGLPTDVGAGTGGQLRDYLRRLEAALTGLADLFRDLVKSESPESSSELLAYIEVLDGDASRSLTTVTLVHAQPAISSQLIDNFNASIHIRALLTDLFLIDDILKLQIDADSNPDAKPDANPNAK